MLNLVNRTEWFENNEHLLVCLLKYKYSLRQEKINILKAMKVYREYWVYFVMLTHEFCKKDLSVWEESYSNIVRVYSDYIFLEKIGQGESEDREKLLIIGCYIKVIGEGIQTKGRRNWVTGKNPPGQCSFSQSSLPDAVDWPYSCFCSPILSHSISLF